MSAPAMKVRPAAATTMAVAAGSAAACASDGRQAVDGLGAERVDRRVVDEDDGHAAVEAD